MINNFHYKFYTFNNEVLKKTSPKNPYTTPPPQKENITLFNWEELSEHIKDAEPNFSIDDWNTLMNLYDEIDSKNVDEFLDEEPDSILNKEEQKNLLEALKNKHPYIYGIVNKFFEKLQNKSNTNRIADNLLFANSEESIIAQELKNLNKDNCMDIIKIYNGTSLLHDLYSITDNRIKNSKNITNALQDLKLIKNKCTELAEYYINYAKTNNIYIEDYEQEIKLSTQNDDIKNLTIATQRLLDRILVTTDKNKELGVSKKAIKLKEANGKVDETFVQGYTGDCWFLSALHSMRRDENVLQEINNMITINKENGAIKSVTVNLQGKNYIIDYKNLKGAKEYASGDLDVRALEMAINKFMHENNYAGGDINLSGYPEDACKILFGEKNIKTTNYLLNSNEKFNKYLDALKDDTFKKLSSTISTDKDASAQDKDGNIIKLIQYHEYCYSKIDKNFFYFINPHSPEIELKIPINKINDVFLHATIITHEK